MLDCARRVLLRLNLSVDAASIKDLSTKLLSKHQAVILSGEPLEDCLPPRESIVINFVGRDREMDELREWFSDPVSRRWALAGEGGKGKTALAYNFAFEIKMKAPPPYQTVLWLSAKRRKFLEGIAVIINEPDFYNLNSALSSLLNQYGWVDEVNLPTESKRKRTLELLSEFPALVVIDDVDSVDVENEDAIEFFSLQLPNTRSKVLFTSRRTIFGMGGTTTHISGFSPEEVEQFIVSRCQLMELDPSIFNKDIVMRITGITEGSPLFIEDLMRFTANVGSAKEAIKFWEEKGGKEARMFALGRECDLLTTQARDVLFAACVCSKNVSFPEIEEVTGLSSGTITKALQELQRLFLVMKPKLIEGEQRFEVNINTRALVHDVYGSTDRFRRILDAHRVISGQIENVGKGNVAAIIRQALFLLRGSKHTEAEQLLVRALEKYPSNSDLYGVLGVVYKAWKPVRISDAREKFTRAHQLKCAKQEMYEHWYEMEDREKEWALAAKAAEKGLKFDAKNKKLHYLAGVARSKLAKEYRGGLHREKAKEEHDIARRHLEGALRASGDTKDQWLDAKIYRSLVLMFEQTGNKRKMEHYFRQWKKRFPEDADLASELERIGKNYKIDLSTDVEIQTDSANDHSPEMAES
jgi:tetratricopeptide (TPR) repeat protein